LANAENEQQKQKQKSAITTCLFHSFHIKFIFRTHSSDIIKKKLTNLIEQNINTLIKILDCCVILHLE